MLTSSHIRIQADETKGEIGLPLRVKEENGNLNVYGNEEISIRDIVSSNEVALRNFIIAIPASLYSLIIGIFSVFKG